MDDSIYVTSGTLPENLSPIVVIRYKECEYQLTVTEARTRAEAILKAASIAEVEGNMFQLLNPPAKGFNKHQPSKESLKMLNYLRSKRSPLPEDINPIFGFNTQQALVELKCYGLTVEPDVARNHAQLLIECAEASETDGFLYHFLRDRIGSEPEEAQVLIQEFAGFRQRNRLEDLFKK